MGFLSFFDSKSIPLFNTNQKLAEQIITSNEIHFVPLRNRKTRVILSMICMEWCATFHTNFGISAAPGKGRGAVYWLV